MNADSQLTEAKGEIDHKLPEIIKAVGDAAAAIGPGGQRASSGEMFFPPLPDNAGNPVDIQVVELGN